MDELQTDIIAAAGRGDEKAFRQLYDHYVPFVWRVAYRMADGDQDFAAQVAQDVFVRVHRSLRRFRYKSAFSTWLYRIAYNRALSAVKRRTWFRQRTQPLSDDLTDGGGAARLDARRKVHRLLQGLLPDERFLLVAREVEGIPFEELAEVMGANAGALRTRLSRLKSMLRMEGTP